MTKFDYLSIFRAIIKMIFTCMTSADAFPPIEPPLLKKEAFPASSDSTPAPAPEKKNQVWADNVVADESIYADNFKLSARDLIANLIHIPYWQGMLLKRPNMQREFILKDYRKAQIFVNKIMDIAVRVNHFPKITVIRNKVLIGIRTSEVDGITLKDLKLAQLINSIALN